MDKLRYHEIIRQNQTLRRKRTRIKFRSGKLVRVTFVKRPNERQFIQFIGICISRKRKDFNSNLVVRNTLTGYGTEVTVPQSLPAAGLYPFYSVGVPKFRKSKLYFLRNVVANFLRIKFQFGSVKRKKKNQR